jgi:hypothetical protein
MCADETGTARYENIHAGLLVDEDSKPLRQGDK